MASTNGKKVPNRPLQHLIPLEVNTNTQSIGTVEAPHVQADPNNETLTSNTNGRPKRNAAILDGGGDVLQRRQKTSIWVQGSGTGGERVWW